MAKRKRTIRKKATKTKKTTIKKQDIQVKTFDPHDKKTELPIHVLLVALLMVLSGVLVYPLFSDGFSRFIENIEGAHIANAQYIFQNWNENWNNLWYFGFPTHLTYPPVMPYLIALMSKIFSLSITHSYRIITAIFVLLTPLSIYSFVHYLTKRKTAAFLGSLMYILLPSIAYLFIPQITSTPSIAGWPPYQLIVFSQFGEGPHLVSLFFLPLAALYFIKSYRQPDILNYIGAAMFIALTMLTNLFGGFALLVILALIVIGKLAIYIQNFSIKRLLIIGLLSYALTAFYFDYSFIQSILQSGYIHPENMPHWPPFLLMFVLILFGVLPITLFLRHKLMGNDRSFKWFLMTTWTLVFLGVGIVFYHYGYSLVTQPNRYLPEAQIGFVVLLAMFFTNLIDFVKFKYTGTIKYLSHATTIIAIFILIVMASYQYISNPHFLLKPVSMDNTFEYKIARWLDENIDPESGDRAYLTGTPAFWLNVFSDTPQIRGGADNAQPNPWWADIAYQINKGENPEIAQAWLQILNIKYILVNYPESGTHYVDYTNYDRFNNYKLAEEFADGGLKMYAVPDAQLSLFTINDLSKYPRQGIIANKKDNDAIFEFAQIINQGDIDRVEYKMISPSRYHIKLSDIKPGESIIFKTNYDQRWQAADQNDTQLAISAIGPNLILINPNATGDMTIDLRAKTLNSENIGLAITIIALLLSAWIINQRKKKLID
ncbi:glycosyltransferase family 39 protein [Patescibacteria group bacterium]|nr:glycosyltransferase family 39 protein [Patescibacteria group bacterium]